MTSGILIVSYNRPEYFRKCLDSFRKAAYPENCRMLVIDDYSTDPETIRLYNEFEIPDLPIIKIRNKENKKIAANIKMGYELLFNMGCNVVMNFDSDAVVKPHAIDELLKLHQAYPDNIGTGFNCMTKNTDGSERHKILYSESGVHFKSSVGGLNMMCNWTMYTAFMQPALDGSGNWDHKTCLNSNGAGHPIACLSPSVVQHIGIVSSMGHSTGLPDVADDFCNLRLPNITLIGADTNHFAELQKAARISCTDIQFGAVKMLKPAEIKSARDYNFFCMKKFNDHVETDFALIIQWDGYIINYQGWNDEFLNYDYIGATWLYKDGMNVGNGGFSLRSKKLLQILATDEQLVEFFPEDHHICRTYRRYLEQNYGIKFAPEEIANKFSIEAYGSNVLPGATKYAGQFGFHGFNVDYSGSGLTYIPTKPAQQINKPRLKNFAFR